MNITWKFVTIKTRTLSPTCRINHRIGVDGTAIVPLHVPVGTEHRSSPHKRDRMRMWGTRTSSTNKISWSLVVSRQRDDQGAGPPLDTGRTGTDTKIGFVGGSFPYLSSSLLPRDEKQDIDSGKKYIYSVSYNVGWNFRFDFYKKIL